MPLGKCNNCSSITNSYTSNYWQPVDENGIVKEMGTVTVCYAKFVGNNWEKGCWYDKIDAHKRAIMDTLIAARR